MDRIRNAFSHLGDEIRGGGNQIFSRFRVRSGYGRAKGFFASNTLVAYVAFLLLMVVLFLIILRLGTALMVKFATPTGSPSFWVRGQCNTGLGSKCAYSRFQPNATIGNTWMQGGTDAFGRWDSKCGNCPQSVCQTVLRSKDGRYGIEFTWSIWLWINSVGSTTGKRQHIFSKGSDTVSMDDPTSPTLEDKLGMLTPNNAPGLYLHPSKNALYVVMNTFDMIDEEVEINDIPLNKWVNIIIRNEGRILDVYVNGTIAIRHKLSSVPKQNYGNVHATKNGGFDGKWSLLHYYDHALNTTEIMDIVTTGPDLRTCSPSPITPPYLSMQWYFDNPQD